MSGLHHDPPPLIFRLCLCWHDPGRFMDSTLTGHITNEQMVAGSNPAKENFNGKLFPGMGGRMVDGTVPG